MTIKRKIEIWLEAHPKICEFILGKFCPKCNNQMFYIGDYCECYRCKHRVKR